jgi:hypothetical protein
VGPALLDVPDRVDQLTGRELAVDQVAARSSAEGLLDDLRLPAVGQHDDRGDPHQVRERRDAVHAGHAYVEEDDIGLVLSGGLVGLAAVGGLRHDRDVLAAGEQGGEAGADHRVVVGHDDPEAALLCGLREVERVLWRWRL